jgi:hypothetical protein
VCKKKRRKNGRALTSWWFGEMVATNSPITERLVLFWHNHFTSSLRKVKWPQLLYRQNELFWQQALGNFTTLLRTIVTDPAMLMYLDGRANRVCKPNENFARELLELFTLGEGQGYTEKDIREAARAFTGWRVRPRDGFAKFILRRHDDGIKNFLNREDTIKELEIIAILLQRSRVAEHITEKLWRAFVSYEENKPVVRQLAQTFRQSGYQIRPLLKGLLLSKEFRDPVNRGTLIKSLVDLIVSVVRLMGIRMENLKCLMRFSKRLGQDLFDPPNVKGWPGGTIWITSPTLPARQQLLRRLSRSVEMASRRGTGAKMKMGKSGMTPGPAMLDPIKVLGGGSLAQLQKVVLPIALSAPSSQSSPGTVNNKQQGSRALKALLLDPAFQLKQGSKIMSQILKRRDFLALGAALPLAMGLLNALAQIGGHSGGTPNWNRTLILIELKGGNDGLNAVIPHGDPNYYRLRPHLGIPKHKVIQLTPQLGLHPSLSPLKTLWEDGSMAIVSGGGYSKPNHRRRYRRMALYSAAMMRDRFMARICVPSACATRENF